MATTIRNEIKLAPGLNQDQTLVSGRNQNPVQVKCTCTEGTEHVVCLVHPVTHQVESQGETCQNTDQSEVGPYVSPAVSGVHTGDSFESPESVNLAPFDGNILDVMKIPSRLNRIEWSTTSTGLLTVLPVQPNITKVEKIKIGPEDYDVHYPTNLSHFSKFYYFWRGGLKFGIEVIASKFHQGQLYACFCPGAKIGNPKIEYFYTLNGVTIDVSTDSRVEVEVPYVSHEDMQDVNGSANAPAQGYVYIFVLNPLIVNSLSVSNHVFVNIDISAMDDFRLVHPTAMEFRENHKAVVSSPIGWQDAKWLVKEKPTLEQQSDRDPNSVASVTGKYHGQYASTIPRINVPAENVTTENILDTKYYVEDFTISTTDKADKVQSFDLPEAFLNKKFNAPGGLFAYHQLMKMDFEVDVRIPTTGFHVGQVVVCFYPADNQKPHIDVMKYELFGTVRNLPHVILDLRSQTQGSFTIPYAATTRALRTSGRDHMGSILVYSYTPLATGTGSTSSLTGKISLKAVNPVVGVRTVKQSNTDDHNYLVELNEFKQTPNQRLDVKYTFTKIGQQHKPVYECRVRVKTKGSKNETRWGGVGCSCSKNAAMQLAAKDVLEVLKDYDFCDDIKKCYHGIHMEYEQLMQEETFPCDCLHDVSTWKGIRKKLWEIDHPSLRHCCPELYDPFNELRLPPALHPRVLREFLSDEGENVPDHLQQQADVGGNDQTNATDTALETAEVVMVQETIEEVDKSLPYAKPNTINEILQRPDLVQVGTYSDTRTTGGSVHGFFEGSRRLGDNQSLCKLIFAYQSGAVDYQFNIGMPRSYPNVVSVVGVPYHIMTNPGNQIWQPFTGSDERLAVDSGCGNTVTYNAGVEPNKVIRFKQYRQVPLAINSHANQALYKHTLGGIRVYYITDDAKRVIPYSIYSSVAPDYRLHYLKTAPAFAYDVPKIPPSSEDDRTPQCSDGWVPNLSECGDVETNPGPVMSTLRAPSLVQQTGEDDDDTSGLMQRLIDGTFTMAQAVFSSTTTGLASVLQWLRRKPSELLDTVIATLGKAVLGSMTKAFIESAKAVLAQVAAFLKGLFLAVYLSRKIYLVCTSSYSVMDVLSDMLMLASTDMVQETVTYLTDTFKHMGALQEQAGEESSTSIIASMGAVVVSLLFGSVGAKSAPHAQHALRFLSLRFMSESIRDIYKLIKEAFEYGVNYFFDGQDKAQVDQAKQTLDDMKETMIDLIGDFYRLRLDGSFHGSKLYEKFTGKLDTPYVTLMRCHNALGEIRCAIELIPTYKPTWVTFIKDVEEVWNIVRKSRVAAAARPEPVGIFLGGQSGQGKSYISTTLVPEYVLTKLGLASDRKDAPRLIYNMPNNPDQQYMDGYWGQPFAIYDDLGSGKEGKDMTMMLNYISSSIAPVNMASLEDKGQLFSSTFMCATSNMCNFSAVTSLNFPDALIRRFPCSYWIATKQAYRTTTGTLDFDKMTNELKDCSDAKEECALYDAIFTISKLNLKNGGDEEKINFADFIDEICAEYVKRVTAGTNNAKVRKAIDIPLFQEDEDDEDEADVDGFGDALDVLQQHTGDGDIIRLTEPPKPVDHQGESVEVEFSQKDKVRIIAAQLNPGKLGDSEFHKLLCNVWGNEILTADPRAINDTWNHFFTRLDCKSFTAMRLRADEVVFEGMCHEDKVNVMHGLLTASVRILNSSYPRRFKKTLGLVAGVVVGVSCSALNSCVDSVAAVYAKVRIVNTKLKDQTYLRWTGIKQTILSHSPQRKTFSSAFMKVSKWLVKYGLIPIVMTGLLAFAKFIFGKFQPAQQAYTKDFRIGKRRELGAIPRIPVNAQAGEIRNERVERSVIMISNLNGTKICSAIAYDDRHIIVNTHTVYYVHKHEEGHMRVLLRDCDGKEDRWVTFPIGPFIQIKDFMGRPTDASLMRMPWVIPGVRKLARSFMSQEQLTDMLSGLSRTALVKLSYTSEDREDIKVVYSEYALASYSKDDPIDGTPYMCFKALQPTRVGDCGTPYMLDNFIIGIHSNYSPITKNLGATPLFREALESALDSVAKVEGVVSHVDYEPVRVVTSQALQGWESDDQSFKARGQFIGEDGNVLSTFQPRGTDKVESELANPDLWPDDHKPTEKSFPILVKRCQKYGFKKDCVAPGPDENTYVINYWKRIFDAVPQRPKGLLSWYDVLNGNEELNIMPMKMDTSPGVWNAISKGKKDLVDFDVESDGKKIYKWSEEADKKIHPAFGKSFLHVLREREEMGRRGERYTEVIWTTTLKDELKPTEKVEQGKTRVFECPPFDSTCLFKRYFGTFAGWYRGNAGPVLSHAIGLDKEANWAVIWGHLKKLGRTRGVDLDYKEFDGSIPPAAFAHFDRLVREYYAGDPEEDHIMRSVLLHELQFTQQLVGSFVCQSMKGNKSGNWLTDLFNSVVNQWAWMICFHRAAAKIGHQVTIEDWVDYITLFTLGDDAIMSANDTVLEWYNGETIGRTLDTLGFYATGSDKKELKSEAAPLETLTFLKSSFFDDGVVVLPPMPKEISYRELNWVKKSCRENVTVRREMVADGLRFMAWHGPDEYYQFVEDIRRELHNEEQLNIYPPVFPSWSEIYQSIWSKQQLVELNGDVVTKTYDAVINRR